MTPRAPGNTADGPEAVALVEELRSAAIARDEADARIVELLTTARAMRPPVPVAALAGALGVSTSAISVRLARLARDG